jgi:hypothetical protein
LHLDNFKFDEDSDGAIASYPEEILVHKVAVFRLTCSNEEQCKVDPTIWNIQIIHSGHAVVDFPAVNTADTLLGTLAPATA